MDTIERLEHFLQKRGWSEYRLMKESGLSQSTISNIFRRGSIPSIPTLEIICEALNMTLSQFFAEEDSTLTLNDQTELLNYWNPLSDEQKKLMIEVMRQMKK